MSGQIHSPTTSAMCGRSPVCIE